MGSFILKRKTFSIESGSPTGGKGSLGREISYHGSLGMMGGTLVGTMTAPFLAAGTGLITKRWGDAALAAAGSITGGALIGSIISIISSMTRSKDVEKFKACTMESIISKVNHACRSYYSPDDALDLIERFRIDEKPDKSHDVIFAVKDGCGVMVINTTRPEVLRYLNESLDSIISGNRKANYESMKTGNGYLVTLTGLTIDNYAELIFNTLAAYNEVDGQELELNVNCLTSKTIRC